MEDDGVKYNIADVLRKYLPDNIYVDTMIETDETFLERRRTGGLNYPPPTLYPDGKIRINFKKEYKPVEPVLTDQQKLDAEVREAIAAPRREAEAKRRKELVEKLGTEDERPVGAVLKFNRKYGKGKNAKLYTYVALKVDDDLWFVTGTTSVCHDGQTWEALLTWMTTGETTVEDVQVAATWDKLV